MCYKVSVVVPVYNEEKYLNQCIESLINQTFRSIQIVLVDDGSKDSSGTIIDTYAKQFSNIESYHKKNGGSSSARNFGLSKAKGEYVAFLDSDDWLESDTIEILYNIAVKNGEVDIVQFRAFDEKDYHIPRQGYYDLNQIKEEIYPFTMPSFTEEGQPTYIRWSSCMRFYKKKMIEDNQLQFRTEARTFEDFLFTFESILVAQSYYFYDEKPLYHVVANPMSMSRNYQPAMNSTCDYGFYLIKDYISGCPKYRTWFSYNDTVLYFASACITNELLVDSLVSNALGIKRVLKSPLCVYLRKNNHYSADGWYGKVLELIRKNNAFYFVYRFKTRKKVLATYKKIRRI